MRVTMSCPLSVALLLTACPVVAQAAWLCQPVAQATEGPSLALDGSGNPHIAYISADGHLCYAKKVASTWEFQTVDAAQARWGGTPTFKLDSEGDPHIVYTATTGSVGCVRYAEWCGSDWVFWDVQLGDLLGTYLSLALSSADEPYIAWRDWSAYDQWYGRPSAWVHWTQKDTGHWYAISVDLMTWQEAEQAAVAAGGHLVTINDSNENQWIFDNFIPLTPRSELGIGFTDDQDEGNWRWLTGESVTYTNWAPGEPNGGPAENMAAMYRTTGMWQDNVGTPPDITKYLMERTAPPAPCDWSWASSNLTPESVYPGNYGLDNFIALDESDDPHIVCSYGVEGLAYFRWNPTDPASVDGWVKELPDLGPGFGTWPCMAFDSAGRPRILHGDQVTHRLRYLTWTGSSWNVEVLEALGSAFGGRLALDSQDREHIAYFDDVGGAVKYAVRTDSGWQISEVATGPANMYPSIALDAQDNPRIAYLSEGWVYYCEYREPGPYRVLCELGPANFTSNAHVAPDRSAVFVDNFFGSWDEGVTAFPLPPCPPQAPVDCHLPVVNWDVRPSADSQSFYVDDYYGGTVQRYDLACNHLRTIAVGSWPARMAFGPARRYLYVNENCTGLGSNSSVVKIDTQSDTVVGQSPRLGCELFAWPVVSPDGAYVYVVCSRATTVFKIDTASMMTVASHDYGLAQPICRISLSPDGAFLFVPDEAGNQVLIADAANLEPVDAIAVPAPGSLIASPDGAYGLVVNASAELLMVVDLASRQIVQQLAWPGASCAIDPAFDGNLVYFPRDDVVVVLEQVVPPRPALLSSEPPADGTLPKSQNNRILLTFDAPIGWSYVQPLNTARQCPGAALGGDGRIYVLGGYGPTWPGGHDLSSVEAYDPTAGQWAYAASLNEARRWPAAAADDQGRIFAAGGRAYVDDVDIWLNSVERYDPADPGAGWTYVSPMLTTRSNFQLVASHGKLYAIGGVVSPSPAWNTTATVEVYDPVSDTWSWAPPLNTPRASFGAGVDTLGRIYVFGGATTGGDRISSAERYDPSITDPGDPDYGWHFVASMPSPIQVGGSASDKNGLIYALGGYEVGHLNVVQVYDPDLDSWSVHSYMNRAINNFAAAIDRNNFLYAIGGEHFDCRDEVERIRLIDGPPLNVVPIAGGPDVGGFFTYSIQPDQVTLKATEPGQVLTNMVWYRLTPRMGFAVQPFVLDLCTLRGDADNTGDVLALDYFPVKNHLFETTDARYDLDGNGQVLATDYFVVKNHLFEICPSKPNP